jgi:hypothetical protein
MDHRTKKQTDTASVTRDDTFDLTALLHPANAFAHPMDVVRDADLTLNEKRAILASWASDACAVEAAPELRATRHGTVVNWDDIMDALRTLDHEAMSNGPPRARSRWRRWRRWHEDSGSGPGHGAPLN